MPNRAWLTQALGEPGNDLTFADAHLFERIAISDRDGLVLESLSIDGNAERGTCLVLAVIAPSDRALVVEVHRHRLLGVAIQLLGHLWHSLLVHEREERGLDRRELGMEGHVDARLHDALGVRLLIL